LKTESVIVLSVTLHFKKIYQLIHIVNYRHFLVDRSPFIKQEKLVKE